MHLLRQYLHEHLSLLEGARETVNEIHAGRGLSRSHSLKQDGDGQLVRDELSLLHDVFDQ